MKFEILNSAGSTMMSNQEKKDLLKFFRLFTLKAAQVIVLARCGNKETTACKQQSSLNDWFNLNINDLPEVLVEARRAINNNESTEHPTCVEISLKTPEGEDMTLETWTISHLPEESPSTPRVIPTVYNQMSLLLRSLISVTRIIPAYKMSRKQSAESYVICYRVYIEKPLTHTLGEGSKQIHIGQVCTPIGILQLGVFYRTKMNMTPTGSGNMIFIKSNHFQPNLSPKNQRSNQSEDKQRSRKLQPSHAAFADPRPPRTREPVPAFKPGGVLWNPKLYYAIVEGKDFVEENKEIEDPFTFANITKRWQEANKENQVQEVNKEKQTQEDQTKTSPTGSTKTLDNEEIATNSSSGSADQVAGRLELVELTSSNTSLNKMDDSIKSTSSFSKSKFSIRKVGKPVHYPFANPTPQNELMNFHRECIHAPQLESLQTSTFSLNNITEQLDAFEMKVQEYDDMVSKLCSSPENDD